MYMIHDTLVASDTTDYIKPTFKRHSMERCLPSEASLTWYETIESGSERNNETIDSVRLIPETPTSPLARPKLFARHGYGERGSRQISSGTALPCARPLNGFLYLGLDMCRLVTRCGLRRIRDCPT